MVMFSSNVWILQDHTGCCLVYVGDWNNVKQEVKSLLWFHTPPFSVYWRNLVHGSWPIFCCLLCYNHSSKSIGNKRLNLLIYGVPLFSPHFCVHLLVLWLVSLHTLPFETSCMIKTSPSGHHYGLVLNWLF